jgi:hypothetical protein
MALQSSGPISLLDIQNEFGGSAPIGINEYYGAGDAPSYGEISIGEFYGSSAFQFTSYIFGEGGSTSNYDSLYGNTITPGSFYSPKTFNIILSHDVNNWEGYQGNYLYYYQDGTLNTTWRDNEDYPGGLYIGNVTFNFGSSSMRFDSEITDTAANDSNYGYTSITWNTAYGAPSDRTLFYHKVQYFD